MKTGDMCLIMEIQKNNSVRNAILIGTLCSISYLGVYFARNILSVVTPQIIESGVYTEEYIGSISSMFFTFYAVGQLINGLIGDKIKARYMISFGLLLSGVCNVLFPYMLDQPFAAHLTYGMIGFFLSMIYAPMTKVVDVLGYKFLLTHGQGVDIENSARDHQNLYGEKIDVFMVGHLHKSETFTAGMGRNGSIQIGRASCRERVFYSV